MMICPRCGFSQPEDKFCANCGLNIANYLAKPKPFHQRLLSSSVFYVALVIIGLFLAIKFIRNSDFSQAVRDTFPLGNTPPIANLTSPTPNEAITLQANPPASPSPKQMIQKTESLPTENTISTASEDNSERANALNDTDGVGPENTTKLNLGNVEADFYLFARDTWQAIQQESRVITEQGNLRVRQISNSERTQAILALAKRQLFAKPIDSQINAVTHISFPLGGNPERPAGLFLDFSVHEKDSSQMAFDFSFDFNAPDNVQASRPVIMSLRLSAGTILFFSQLLPRKALPETMHPVAAGTPLEVLTLPEYLEGNDELVLAISGSN